MRARCRYAFPDIGEARRLHGRPCRRARPVSWATSSISSTPPRRSPPRLLWSLPNGAVSPRRDPSIRHSRTRTRSSSDRRTLSSAVGKRVKWPALAGEPGCPRGVLPSAAAAEAVLPVATVGWPFRQRVVQRRINSICSRRVAQHLRTCVGGTWHVCSHRARPHRGAGCRGLSWAGQR